MTCWLHLHKLHPPLLVLITCIRYSFTSHPRCWLGIYRCQRAMLCFQWRGLNKNEENVFGQCELQRLICGGKHPATDTFCAVIPPQVWERVKLSGQTLAAISLFSGVKWTGNQTQTALFCLSFNTAETFTESTILSSPFPCVCEQSMIPLFSAVLCRLTRKTEGSYGGGTRLNQITA